MLFQSYNVTISDGMIYLPQEVRTDIHFPLLVTPRWQHGADLLMPQLAEKLIRKCADISRTSLNARPIIRAFRENCSQIHSEIDGCLRLPRWKEFRLTGNYTLMSIGHRIRLVEREIWEALSDPRESLELQSRARRVLSHFTSLANPYSPSPDTWRRLTKLQERLRSPQFDTAEPRELERIAAEILDNVGVGIVELTPPGGDGGRDLIVHLPSERASEMFLIECKKWNNPIGVEVFRGLLGADPPLGGPRLLIATSPPTRPAQAKLNVRWQRYQLFYTHARRFIEWLEKDPPDLGFGARIREIKKLVDDE